MTLLRQECCLEWLSEWHYLGLEMQPVHGAIARQEAAMTQQLSSRGTQHRGLTLQSHDRSTSLHMLIYGA